MRISPMAYNYSKCQTFGQHKSGDGSNTECNKEGCSIEQDISLLSDKEEILYVYKRVLYRYGSYGGLNSEEAARIRRALMKKMLFPSSDSPQD